MFESETYENIMQRMLERVSDNVDKREGSIIYDALAPAAVELAMMYVELDNILNEAFADTASYEYLIRRAAERGLTPTPATYAVLKGVFTPADIDVLGQRFNLGELNYVVTEKISDGIYQLECETAGETGNSQLGRLLPIDYIEGLETAELTEVLVYGEDDEEVDTFRQRYYDSINNISFGGNVADYKEKVGAMDGVGAVRVYRADDWLGAGTVKIAIAAPGGEVPSDELIADIKEALDPTDYTGDGIGIAPIGHQVTVVGAEGVTVNIAMSLTYDSYYLVETLYSNVKAAVGDYIESVNEEWAAENTETIYISGIIAAVKGVEGVIDVYNVTINGKSTNLTLKDDSLAVCGDITLEGEGV